MRWQHQLQAAVLPFVHECIYMASSLRIAFPCHKPDIRSPSRLSLSHKHPLYFTRYGIVGSWDCLNYNLCWVQFEIWFCSEQTIALFVVNGIQSGQGTKKESCRSTGKPSNAVHISMKYVYTYFINDNGVHTYVHHQFAIKTCIVHYHDLIISGKRHLYERPYSTSQCYKGYKYEEEVQIIN